MKEEIVYTCTECKEDIWNLELLEWKLDAIKVSDFDKIVDSVKCPECYYAEHGQPIKEKILYRVGTFREVGLDAKWSKTGRGEPYIGVKLPEQKTYTVCDAQMFKTMEREGIKQGYETHTVLGDIFSIKVR